jgi:DNA-binding CsgD family transcriptional regulator
MEEPAKTTQHAPLSPREHQVLAMAAQGLSNSEVAEQLCVSVHAVKFHLAAVYRKLGVGNRTEAAVAFVRGTAATQQSG